MISFLSIKLPLHSQPCFIRSVLCGDLLQYAQAHFSARCHGQLPECKDIFRNFEIGKPGPEELEERFCVQILSLFDDDARRDLLLRKRIGNAHNFYFFRHSALDDRFFDLAGRNVLSGPDDHLFSSACDADLVKFVEIPDVARLEPAVFGHGLSRLLGHLVILFENIEPRLFQLAGLSELSLLRSVGVDHRIRRRIPADDLAGIDIADSGHRVLVERPARDLPAAKRVVPV